MSGVCSTFYLDGDGDGSGTGTGVMQCGTTVPGGYANRAGDCCDSDRNAHPGQTSYFTSADTCGSFDYNCDGAETPRSNGPTDCGTPVCLMSNGTCTYMGGCTCGGDEPCTTYGTAACGSSYYLSVRFCYESGGSCSNGGNGSIAGTQACN